VEAQYDFTKLDAIPIGERALAIGVRELFVVHDDRVGLGKIRDRPPSCGERESSMLATHRARVERDVLRRASRIAAKNELRLLSLNTNEANFLMAVVTRENLEMTREQLDYFVSRALEAHRFRSDRLQTLAVDREWDPDRAIVLGARRGLL
jgi:hypothetical protein